MELILFIFLGVVLFVCIGSDKRDVREASQNTEKRILWFEERQKSWRELVSDRALEEDLRYFIADPKNYDAVWEEVRSAYSQMPSYGVCTQISLFPSMVKGVYNGRSYTQKQRENIASSNRRMALDIMLARRGKVRDANTWGSRSFASFAPGEGRRSKLVWDMTFDFWLYIRDELVRNGVDAKLIFKRPAPQNNQELVYYVDHVDEFHYQSGELTWLPLTYLEENLKPYKK